LVDNRHEYPNGPEKTESRDIGTFKVIGLPSEDTVQMHIDNRTKKETGTLPCQPHQEIGGTASSARAKQRS
jgi:hypothetical protein